MLHSVREKRAKMGKIVMKTILMIIHGTCKPATEYIWLE
jgi:hypothetical protein